MHDFCDYARLEMQSFYMYFIYIYIYVCISMGTSPIVVLPIYLRVVEWLGGVFHERSQ